MLRSRAWGFAAMGHPDILLIGHVTRDLLSADPRSDHRLGGAVSFGAVTAVRLGRAPTVITRAAPSTDLSALPAEAEVTVLPSPSTTTFANVYTERGRVQYCHARALPIVSGDIDVRLRRPRAVLLGPLVGEIGPDVAGLFGDATLVVAAPQGWMRRWDGAGRVCSGRWDDAGGILRCLDVVVLSREDIEHDLGRLEPFFEQVPLVVVTGSRDGSTLYRCRGRGAIVTTRIPPRPAEEVDPTGAGDVFATAFMIRLEETGDPVQSARFANVAASFGVEQAGMGGIPCRETILAYMQEHPFEPSTGGP
ncbi:PfkB family carbohydrate kinase [Sorangium sp. So ce315]|uniref:PfkB family carbohydrate kinase n=1 Tax=Sorangium sp. So ce315 TaxID=3133299 RepID=UPI003F5F7F40